MRQMMNLVIINSDMISEATTAMINATVERAPLTMQLVAKPRYIRATIQTIIRRVCGGCDVERHREGLNHILGVPPPPPRCSDTRAVA